MDIVLLNFKQIFFDSLDTVIFFLNLVQFFLSTRMLNELSFKWSLVIDFCCQLRNDNSLGLHLI